MNKTIEILNKGNSKFKLTITPTRITIKLAENSSLKEQTDVIYFFTKISNTELMSNIEKSFRGTLKDEGIKKLVMYNDSKSEAYLFEQIDEVNIACQKI